MKNVIVTMIAGSFFAASVVVPAFATGGADADPAPPNAPLVRQQQPVFSPTEDLPDIQLPDRLPSVEKIGERLKNLDLEKVLDNNDVALPGPIAFPERAPEIPTELPERLPQFPTELPKLEPSEPMESVSVPKRDDAEAEAKVVDDLPDPDERATKPQVPVKQIIADAKAEKASILAANGGERRAAKAELKAAQMRMVERIKANNGARGKASGKRQK